MVQPKSSTKKLSKNLSKHSNEISLGQNKQYDIMLILTLVLYHKILLFTKKFRFFLKLF